jgi:hypothetical protein
VDRQQLDSIEVDFKDSKETLAIECPSSDTTDEMLKDDNAGNEAPHELSREGI